MESNSKELKQVAVQENQISTHLKGNLKENETLAEIIEEEEYISELEQIISRDFFPSLYEASTSNTECMSLGEFFSKYISEDNASFKELQNKHNIERLHKLSWYFKDEKLKLLTLPTNLIESSNSHSLKSWDFKAKNSLMFSPDFPNSSKDEANIRAAPKRIVHANTRINEIVHFNFITK